MLNENEKLIISLANSLNTLTDNAFLSGLECLLEEEMEAAYNKKLTALVIKLANGSTTPENFTNIVTFKGKTSFEKTAQGLSEEQVIRCLLTAINIISFNPNLFSF